MCPSAVRVLGKHSRILIGQQSEQMTSSEAASNTRPSSPVPDDVAQDSSIWGRLWSPNIV